MSVQMMRDIDEIEYKIIKTIAEHRQTSKHLGAHQDAIEEACMPHPYLERLTFLAQQRVVAPARTHMGTVRDKEWTITESGQQIYEAYKTGARKVSKIKPLLSRKELLANDVAGEIKQLPLSVVSGADTDGGKNYRGEAVKTVTGRSAAPVSGPGRKAVGR